VAASLTALSISGRPATAACRAGVAAEFPVTMQGMRPMISGSINGIDARFVVDSGAFFSQLTAESAKKYQLSSRPMPPGFSLVQGAGGFESVSLAAAKDFELAGLNGGTLHNVEFLVAAHSVSTGTDGLIGQNILGVADTEYDLANGIIRLMKVTGCEGRPLAYWSGTQPVVELAIAARTFQTPHVLATVKLNGKKIRAIFDTGASVSMITKSAAATIGVTPQSNGVVAAGSFRAIGGHPVQTWIAPFTSLDFGDEQIQNIKIRIGDFEIPGMDLLLGTDFFLSHRIYVANSQHKLYFTYNGGPVFDLTVRDQNQTGQPTGAQQPDEHAAFAPGDDTPKDAAGYRRRATAFAARGDYSNAIGDLDHAVELEPSDPENYYQRATLRMRKSQWVLAMGDLDQTIRLKPDHVWALTQRGDLRVNNGDERGASADFDEVARLAPHDALISYRIATAYDRAGRVPEAIARYDQWVISFPDDERLPEVLNSRCWIRAMAGTDLGLALKDCDEALHRVPNNPRFLDSRAFVHLRRGELDEAIKEYKQALAVQPKSWSSLYGLGVAEAKKGMKAESERDIQAAVAVWPNVADYFKKAGVTP
jgi:tetratricopeptide (TPR) repeat protein/predicted aspartyl protease